MKTIQCPVPFLSKYKNLFGIPGEGIHAVRFIGFGIVDILATIIFAYILKIIVKKYNFIKCFIISIIFGELLHYLLCVDTAGIKLIKKLINNTNQECIH